MDNSSLRRHPNWLIGEPFVDEEIGLLKSGKEASVSLVRRTDGTRSCLLALKRYKPHAAFRRDVYQEGWRFKNARLRSHFVRGTDFGKDLARGRWRKNEFDTLAELWWAGADVPFPVSSEGGLLMEYIGTLDRAANRLIDLRLTVEAAAAVYNTVIRNVGLFLDNHVVHADLSAYNILVSGERVCIIDFPQSVDVAENTYWEELLTRDLENVNRYFRRYGVCREVGDLVAELKADSCL